MKHLLSLLLFLSPGLAAAAGLACDHTIYGAPFVTVTLEILPDGTLGQTAKVSVTSQGRAHPESVTQIASAAGERYHLWLSQESPNNSIEMIVYEGEQPASKLLNHHVGMGGEARGTCRAVEWQW